MSVWPAELSSIKNGSFKETPANNTIRSNMEVGPDKVRRRTTSNIRPMSFTLTKLSSDDIDTLDDFYTNVVYSGADQFDFTHPRTGAALTARFVAPPDFTDIQKDQFEASISLEILP